MNKKIVFITAIGNPGAMPYVEYCLKTWQWWCRVNRVALFILDKAVPGAYPMKPHYQRYHAFDILEQKGVEFDQIAVVDADTMVHWECPDFFSLTGGKLGIVHERPSPYTLRAIKEYAPLFPDVRLQPGEYFNSGLLVLEKYPGHRQLFKDLLTFRRQSREQVDILEDVKKVDIDQTPLNYIVKRSRLPLTYLAEDFNLAHFIPRHYGYSEYYLDMYPIEFAIDLGYIWHFAGLPRTTLVYLMGNLWKIIAHHYI